MIFVFRLLPRRPDGSLERSQRRPIVRGADHLSDQSYENHALIAALKTELSPEVSELPQLAAEAGEAGDTAANAQVDLAALDPIEASEVADPRATGT